MKQAWLVVNAFLQGGSFEKMEQILVDTARLSGIRLITKTNADFIREGSLLDLPKAALFFDKDIRLADRLESRGMRLFNSARGISICDDKTLSALAIEKAGLPQPKTLLCPTTYPGIGYGTASFLETIVEELGLPLVVKEGKGSFGKQVYLVDSLKTLADLVQRLGATELLFQRFIQEAAGTDLRLYVVGGEVVASIKRTNTQNDFRANLENGGVAQPYVPTHEEARLALQACEACQTDFAGVDLLQSKDGPLVCEVNSNAHFLGLMAVTGKNPALAIMDLLKEAL